MKFPVGRRLTPSLIAITLSLVVAGSASRGVGSS